MKKSINRCLEWKILSINLIPQDVTYIPPMHLSLVIKSLISAWISDISVISFEKLYRSILPPTERRWALRISSTVVIVTISRQFLRRWYMAAARTNWTTPALRGSNRRPKTSDSLLHPGGSRRTGRPIFTLGRPRRQDGTPETGWTSDKPRSQTRFCYRNFGQLGTTDTGTQTRGYSEFQHRLQGDKVSRR